MRILGRRKTPSFNQHAGNAGEFSMANLKSIRVQSKAELDSSSILDVFYQPIPGLTLLTCGSIGLYQIRPTGAAIHNRFYVLLLLFFPGFCLFVIFDARLPDEAFLPSLRMHRPTQSGRSKKPEKHRSFKRSLLFYYLISLHHVEAPQSITDRQTFASRSRRFCIGPPTFSIIRARADIVPAV